MLSQTFPILVGTVQFWTQTKWNQILKSELGTN